MKLGDIYVNKTNESLIQIDSFASHMGKSGEDDKESIIIFRQIKNMGDEIGSLPSFNGYGTQEEIEGEYKLLIPQEKLSEYSSWDEIFEMLKR